MNGALISGKETHHTSRVPGYIQKSNTLTFFLPNNMGFKIAGYWTCPQIMNELLKTSSSYYPTELGHFPLYMTQAIASNKNRCASSLTVNPAIVTSDFWKRIAPWGLPACRDPWGTYSPWVRTIVGKSKRNKIGITSTLKNIWVEGITKIKTCDELKANKPQVVIGKPSSISGHIRYIKFVSHKYPRVT